MTHDLRIFLAALGAAAVVAGPARAEEDLVDQIVEAATFELHSFVDAYAGQPASRAADDRAFGWWNRLEGRTMVWMGDTVSLDLEGYVVGRTAPAEHGVLTRPGEDEPNSPYADVTTLRVSWYGDEGTTVAAGKGDLAMGVAELYSPTDRFVPMNYANPLHPFRQGVWQARVEQMVGDDTVSLVVLPFQESSILPGGDSRWLNGAGDFNFFSDISAARTESRQPKLSNTGVLAKWQAVRPGYDFFLAAHHGPGGYPTLRLDRAYLTFAGPVIETSKLYPDATSFLGGAVATVGSWRLYGEGVYQNTHGDRDQDFLRYVLGASYRETDLARRLGLEEINPIVEYAGDYVRSHALQGNVMMNSWLARPHVNTLLARVKVKVDDTWSFSAGGTRNLQDHDLSYTLGGSYKVDDNLSLLAQALFLGGPDNTQFGRWRENDSVSVGLNWRF